MQRKADPKVQQVYDPGKKGTCRPRHAKRNKPDAPRRRTGSWHQGLETRQPRETGLKRSTQSARRSRQEQTCRWGAASRNGPAGSNPKKATICMHHYEQPSQRGQAMRNKLYSNGPSAAARFVTEKFCTALPESVHTYGIALQKEATHDMASFP